MKSFRTRLVLFYTLLSAVVLVIFSLIVYQAVSYQVSSRIDRSLTTRSAHFRGRISFENGRVTIPKGFGGSGKEPRYEEVIGSDGKEISKSFSLGENSISVNLDQLESQQEKPFETSLSDGTPVRATAVPLIHSGEEVSWFVTAVPLAELENTQRDLLVVLLISTLAFFLVAFGAGYIFVGQTLKPIKEITKMAKEISQGDLSQRVGLTGSQDEIKELADTFDEMITKLEELFRSQRDFFSDASHQLRTPLTILRGKIDVALREKKASTKDLQKTLRELKAEVADMSIIVDRLLRLGRAESFKKTIEKRSFSSKQWAKTVAEKAKSLAQLKDISLKTKVDNFSILADKEKLEEALLIILDNAFKFTPPQGEVELRIAKQEGLAILSISDTGGGISAEELPHIFERFYRGKEKTRAPSAGLGLAICKEVVEGHGGTITAESKSGQGSTFTITLPL